MFNNYGLFKFDDACTELCINCLIKLLLMYTILCLENSIMGLNVNFLFHQAAWVIFIDNRNIYNNLTFACLDDPNTTLTYAFLTIFLSSSK